MTRHERDVEMEARLYDCRNAARGILGDKYAETLKPWRALVTRIMEAKQFSVLQAALDIGKNIPPSDELALMLMFAAAVEMIEHPDAVAVAQGEGR